MISSARLGSVVVGTDDDDDNNDDDDEDKEVEEDGDEEEEPPSERPRARASPMDSDASATETLPSTTATPRSALTAFRGTCAGAASPAKRSSLSLIHI